MEGVQKESEALVGGALTAGSGKKLKFVKDVMKETALELSDLLLDAKTYLDIREKTGFPFWYIPAYQMAFIAAVVMSIAVAFSRVVLMGQLRRVSKQ